MSYADTIRKTGFHTTICLNLRKKREKSFPFVQRIPFTSLEMNRSLDEQRLSFWRDWLKDDSPWLGDRDTRLKPSRPFPDWAESLFPKRANRILRVLDLQAGPITSLGTRSRKFKVELHPVDTLGSVFERLLAEAAVKPKIRTGAVNLDVLKDSFPEESFDLIYCCPIGNLPNLRRTLDHASRLLRPGGAMVLFAELSGVPANHPRRSQWRVDRTLKRFLVGENNHWNHLIDLLPGDWQEACELIPGYAQITLRKCTEPATDSSPWEFSAAQDAIARVRKGELNEGLISLHIPKTAGTSFTAILRSLFPQKLYRHYKHEFSTSQSVTSHFIHPHIRCVHGHFQVNAFDACFDRTTTLTWFRDPVERLVSTYYQVLRNPQDSRHDPNYRRVLEEEMNLVDFARKTNAANQVPWYLNGHALADFTFIGIVERMPESLHMLRMLLGDDTAQLDFPQANTNPKRSGSRYELDPIVRQELELILEDEMRLYRKACALFDARWSAVADTFAPPAPPVVEEEVEETATPTVTEEAPAATNE